MYETLTSINWFLVVYRELCVVETEEENQSKGEHDDEKYKSRLSFQNSVLLFAILFMIYSSYLCYL